MKGIKVYDIGDKVLDRYTVVIDGMVYGMSEYGGGFNQFCGELSSYGTVKNFGKLIAIEDLSKEVRQAIFDRI